MVLLQLLRNTVFLPVLLHIFLTVAEHWAYVSFSSSLDRSIWCTLQGFHGLWCVSQTPVTAHVQTQTSKKLKQVSLKHNKCQSSFTLQPEQGQLCLFSGNSLSDCNTNTFEGVHLKTWTSVFAWGWFTPLCGELSTQFSFRYAEIPTRLPALSWATPPAQSWLSSLLATNFHQVTLDMHREKAADRRYISGSIL